MDALDVYSVQCTVILFFFNLLLILNEYVNKITNPENPF